MEDNNTIEMRQRANSEASRLLIGIARNLDKRDGLKNVLESIARTSDYEHWGLEDAMKQREKEWWEVSTKLQEKVDSMSSQLVEALDALVQIAQCVGIDPNEPGFDPTKTPVGEVKHLMITRKVKQEDPANEKSSTHTK